MTWTSSASRAPGKDGPGTDGSEPDTDGSEPRSGPSAGGAVIGLYRSAGRVAAYRAGRRRGRRIRGQRRRTRDHREPAVVIYAVLRVDVDIEVLGGEALLAREFLLGRLLLRSGSGRRAAIQPREQRRLYGARPLQVGQQRRRQRPAGRVVLIQRH